MRECVYVCVWASFERDRNISLTGKRPRQTFCITNGNLLSLPKTLFQAFGDIYVWYIESGVILLFFFYFVSVSDAAYAAHGAGVGLFMM